MSRSLTRGLVVSCQALKDEPMFGGNCMAKMANAAVLGGAVGIRANTVRDIKMIAKKVDVPIVGLIKKVYDDSKIYITPTLDEVKALIKSPCDIIATDATCRDRPNGVELEEIVSYIREHSDKKIMADIATLREAERADKLGFDYVSSTLRSYTEETANIEIPDLDFLRELKKTLIHAEPIAEGGIAERQMVQAILALGYETVIIGGAVTRPMEITRRFVTAFKQVSSSL